jgi:hypothetical protein
VSPRWRSRLRAGALDALLVVVSLVVALGVLELAARVYAGGRAREPQTVGILSLYHPVLGWVKPPSESGWLHEPEFSTWLETNAHGLRGPDRAYARTPGVARVLLLGDSFVEAYTVAEPETARAVLERRLSERGCGPVEVLNAGVAGYGTDQEYLFYLEQGRRYAADVVVLFFFGNDLSDNLRERKKPFFELQDGRLVRRNVPVPPPANARRLLRPEAENRWANAWRGSWALELLSRRTATGNPHLHRALARLGLVRPLEEHGPTRDWLAFYGPETPRSRQGWRLTEALLGALRAAVEADGARLLVLYVPARFELVPESWTLTRERWQLVGDGWRPERPFEALVEACGRRGIRLVDPRPRLTQAESEGRPAYLEHDPHWNALGQALAADVLADALVERELAGCRSR